jgi:hypothetical protein
VFYGDTVGNLAFMMPKSSPTPSKQASKQHQGDLYKAVMSRDRFATLQCGRSLYVTQRVFYATMV